MLCFNDNAHEMMVHMLMSCSYGCTDARQTPGVLQKCFGGGVHIELQRERTLLALNLPVQVSDQLTNTLTHTRLEVEEGGRTEHTSTAQQIVL
jgi:hypothetical protein